MLTACPQDWLKRDQIGAFTFIGKFAFGHDQKIARLRTDGHSDVIVRLIRIKIMNEGFDQRGLAACLNRRIHQATRTTSRP